MAGFFYVCSFSNLRISHPGKRIFALKQKIDMEFEISDFEERDRPELRNLYHNVKRDTFRWMGVPDNNEDTFDRDTKGEEILVIKKGDEIAGFVSVWLPDNFIHHLYVLKQYQRMGLGKNLVNAVRARLKGPLSLKCIEENVSAVKFYESTGWKAKSKGISDHGMYIVFELK